VTDGTHLKVDGQVQPFSMAGLDKQPFDVVYQLADNTVLYLRPIPLAE
jgi:hypothetical protein